MITVKPDKDCSICKGSGVKSEDGKSKECLCILKKLAKQYLTSVYSEAKYMKSFNPTPLLDKNICIEHGNVENFKQYVKSFLLNTGMKFSHESVSAYDILQAYLQDSKSNLFEKLSKVDIIFIFLGSDPNNKHYGNIIKSLIDKRLLHKKSTWIYTSIPVKSNLFSGAYQSEFQKFLQDEFSFIRK